MPGDDRRLRFRLAPGEPEEHEGSRAAATELLRTAVRLAGPLTLGDLVLWLAIRSVTAPPDWLRPVWSDLVDEPVEVDGENLYASPELGDARPSPPMLLPPPCDTYLLGHRTFLVPDRALAKEVWRPVGSPGALVVDGEVIGTWRARRSGRTLRLTVTPRRKLAHREEQADVVAAAREHDGKVVVAVG